MELRKLGIVVFVALWFAAVLQILYVSRRVDALSGDGRDSAAGGDTALATIAAALQRSEVSYKLNLVACAGCRC